MGCGLFFFGFTMSGVSDKSVLASIGLIHAAQPCLDSQKKVFQSRSRFKNTCKSGGHPDVGSDPMQTRRQTAWKKSRKFGDVKGGRTRPKITDNIFARAHSLQRPTPGTKTPLFITDNPSRQFFFPITEQEIRRELSHLPRRDWKGITHIWLRRAKKSEYEDRELPLAQFCCGSGVRLIVLYPWPVNLEWDHGTKMPPPSLQKTLEQYGAQLAHRANGWVSSWNLAGLKNFYIEHLLYHEIGHHVDRYHRRWSKANHREIEEVANQYAFSKTTKRSIVFHAE